MPACAKNVTTRSGALTGCGQYFPSGIVPGMLTISGERYVASYGATFCRRPCSPLAKPWSERVDDQRVVQLAGLLERLDQPSHAFIHGQPCTR